MLNATGRYTEALKWLERVSQIEPDNEKVPAEPVPHSALIFCDQHQLNFANTLYRLGRFGDAVPFFDAVLKKDPKHTIASEGRDAALKMQARAVHTTGTQHHTHTLLHRRTITVLTHKDTQSHSPHNRTYPLFSANSHTARSNASMCCARRSQRWWAPRPPSRCCARPPPTPPSSLSAMPRRRCKLRDPNR